MTKTVFCPADRPILAAGKYHHRREARRGHRRRRHRQARRRATREVRTTRGPTRSWSNPNQAIGRLDSGKFGSAFGDLSGHVAVLAGRSWLIRAAAAITLRMPVSASAMTVAASGLAIWLASGYM